MRYINASVVLWMIVCLSSCTKSLTNSNEARIDSLFREWDKPHSPGAAVAVIKEGVVVFKKGYGQANLEYDIPITPSSVFHIASESKQYVAFCIVLLAQDGKLSLDDDIHRYLPNVPDFGKKITIRHLIYHTSGLRDQWQLLAIGGQSLDDVITQQHIIKLVEKQKELNFEPGSRMLYCNTGYTLLAEIVKKVSGKTLRAYADEKIFKPLGMNQTHFHDDNTEIVKGRTYSYDQGDSGKFSNSPLNYATVGATSLFTTVEDEAKWLNNYETGKVGGIKAINQMYEQCVLNSGRKLNYAFALAIDSMNGYTRIGHGGADAGYRTYAVRFPEAKLGVIVFSNLGNFSPDDMATKIAGLYLQKKQESEKPVYTFKADSTLFRYYDGLYSSDEDGPTQIIDSGKLYLRFRGRTYTMTPTSDSSFTLLNGRVKVLFPSHAIERVPRMMVRSGSEDKVLHRAEKPDLTDALMSEYIGTYESEELEARYHIVLENKKLKLRHRKYPDALLDPVTTRQFSSTYWWMSNILFTRNVKGAITGFEVNCDRVLHLKFRKL